MKIILSTWSSGVVSNRAGWPHLAQSGGALDAVEQGCVAAENDPANQTVGPTGLPDANGDVSLDGCIMLSPAKSAGVACVKRHGHPVSIARRLLERGDHKLLVGIDADDFATQEGFAPQVLLSEKAREKFERWKRDSACRDQLNREARRPNREEAHDTVGVLAIDAGGVLAGACSTSGLPFKLPGRVGDSPIIGHGLYVDPHAGAAVTTGRGELMMGICASFLAVERMRLGDTPSQAARAVLERITHSYDLLPDDQCGIITLRPDGHWAGGALRAGFHIVATTEPGEKVTEPQVVLLER
jgi:N4-(beta-N-acetylglucosaminyl)-L-asparaginase